MIVTQIDQDLADEFHIVSVQYSSIKVCGNIGLVIILHLYSTCLGLVLPALLC